MAMQWIASHRDNDHIRCVLNLDHHVPGVPHEPVIILVFGQVAIVVIGRGRRAADTGNLVRDLRRLKREMMGRKNIDGLQTWERLAGSPSCNRVLRKDPEKSDQMFQKILGVRVTD